MNFLKLPSQNPAPNRGPSSVYSLRKHLAVLESPQGQAQLGAPGTCMLSDPLPPGFREQLSPPEPPTANTPHPQPPKPSKASRPPSPPSRLSQLWPDGRRLPASGRSEAGRLFPNSLPKPRN